jgi:hypothetical protein
MEAARMPTMPERYFYHSFPRRGAHTPQEIDKGCAVLKSIKDFGLAMLPEQIEWTQPLADGKSRVFPVLQKRVCFTELRPEDLPGHAERFGNFALEFEVPTVRTLGAIPVFYIPQTMGAPEHGNALGMSLFGVTHDAVTLIERLASLNAVLNGERPVADKFGYDIGFARSPEGRRKFTLDSAESKNFLSAMSHALTPWDKMKSGVGALLNFIYPADNVKDDELMDYYREREWRIACAFAVQDVPVVRTLTGEERTRLLSIDSEFFSRVLKTDTGDVGMMDASLMHPGIGGKRIVELVRRVIVPQAAVGQASEILADLAKPPPVVAIETLSQGTPAS